MAKAPTVKTIPKPAAKAPAKPASISKPGKPVAAKKVPAAARGKSVTGNPQASKASAKAARKAEKSSDHVDRVWKLAKRMGICMFVTWDGERQRARPLAAHVKRDEHAIYFLTDVTGQKDNQIEKFPIVTLAFADIARTRFVTITGKAVVSNDRARIKTLWSPFAKAWWDSPEDPHIRVIRVEPQDAELWDTPGRIVSTVAMLTAAVTGKGPTVGENAKVSL
jgi:general stress protein 26